MSALTSGRNTVELADGGKFLLLPVLGGAKIYDGSIVVIDEDGYAKPAIKATGLTAVGRSENFVDNTAGDDGELMVKVRRGVFVYDNSSVTAEKVKAEHVLKPCYIVDDCTVSSVATGSSIAGKVIAVYEDGIAVEFR